MCIHVCAFLSVRCCRHTDLH